MWFQFANWKCVLADEKFYVTFAIQWGCTLTDEGYHVIFISQSENSKGIMRWENHMMLP